MKKIRLCMIIVLTVFISVNLFSAEADSVKAETEEPWEKYFYITKEEQELLLKDQDYPQLWKRIEEDIAPYDAELDLSKAFSIYDTWPNDYWPVGPYYKFAIDEVNFEGVPDYFQGGSARYVIIPAFSDAVPKAGVSFLNGFQGRMELLTPEEKEEMAGGTLSLYSYKDDYILSTFWGTVFEGDGELNSIYNGAEAAYNAVKNTGATIKNIRLVSYAADNMYYVIPVEEKVGGYVYDYVRDKLNTFEEFAGMLKGGKWPDTTTTPSTTPTPTPTPTVSRTPFQPMTTTPTATPRPSGTGIAPRPTASAGSGTETAAVSPTASPTVPGPKKAELTWLIPVVVLCGAAAGGIAWAAIAAGKKKKDK